MFSGDLTEGLVALLKERGVRLWHACQFQDFQSYLDIGGLPSRFLLEAEGCSYTAFKSDAQDQKNQIWDKVFLNLSDSGAGFELGRRITPNFYGPISIEFWPEVLLGAQDIAICLKSAGNRSFNRETEALSSLDEVNRLFLHGPDDFRGRNISVKWIPELKDEFPERDVLSHPEISCTSDVHGKRGILPFKNPGISCYDSVVSRVLVEPYQFERGSLRDYVAEVIDRTDDSHWPGIPLNRLQVRPYKWHPYRKKVLSEIQLALSQGAPSISQLGGMDGVSESLKAWSRDIADKGLEKMYNNYRDYLREGTLEPVKDFEAYEEAYKEYDEPPYGDWDDESKDSLNMPALDDYYMLPDGHDHTRSGSIRRQVEKGLISHRRLEELD